MAQVALVKGDDRKTNIRQALPDGAPLPQDAAAGEKRIGPTLIGPVPVGGLNYLPLSRQTSRIFTQSYFCSSLTDGGGDCLASNFRRSMRLIRLGWVDK